MDIINIVREYVDVQEDAFKWISQSSLHMTSSNMQEIPRQQRHINQIERSRQFNKEEWMYNALDHFTYVFQS